MSAAALPLYPAGHIQAGRIALGLLALLWGCLLTGVFQSAALPHEKVLDVMLLAACVVQVLAMRFQGQSLGRSVVVLHMQRSPAALWRQWLRQWLLSVTRYWAILCVGIALLLAMPSSTMHWLAAPAVLSLLLCLSALSTLAHAGLVPRRAGEGAEFALLALVLYVGTVVTFSPAPARIPALPMPVLALCALAWPALACWLAAYKAAALPPVRGSQSPVLRRLRDACARWTGRYQPLGGWDNGIAVSSSERRGALVFAVLLNSIFLIQLAPVAWGEWVGFSRIAVLMLICGFGSGSLLVRDLHWRTVLLPGTTPLRQLGTRILLSTMLFQSPLMLLFALGTLLSLSAGAGLHSFATFGMPLLELIFCTSLMTIVRSLAQRTQIAAYVGVAAAIAMAYLLHAFKPDATQWGWQIGPGYALLLVAATGAALVVANRRWTPRRFLNALANG